MGSISKISCCAADRAAVRCRHGVPAQQPLLQAAALRGEVWREFRPVLSPAAEGEAEAGRGGEQAGGRAAGPGRAEPVCHQTQEDAVSGPGDILVLLSQKTD